MKLLILYQKTGRGWGNRIARFISTTAPESWKVKCQEMPALNLPVIDNPEAFIPENLSRADLLLVLVESTGLAQLIPDIAEEIQAEAVIAPVDFETGCPPGLQNQVKEQLAERKIALAIPEPFCSLTERGVQNKSLRQFAKFYGRPEFELDYQNQKLARVDVLRSSPCGGSPSVAEELEGDEIAEAARKSGLYHQYYPCKASVDIIHRSAYITEAAVKRARQRKENEDNEDLSEAR